MDGSKTWVYFVALAVALLAALLSARIAGRKGHSPVGYGVLGFFLPVVGVIVALVIKDRSSVPSV